MEGKTWTHEVIVFDVQLWFERTPSEYKSAVMPLEKTALCYFTAHVLNVCVSSKSFSQKKKNQCPLYSYTLKWTILKFSMGHFQKRVTSIIVYCI